MDLAGRVLKTIQHDASGAALFEWSRYLTYIHDNHHIYVSDMKRDTVTCLTAEGEVQWTYRGQDLMYPAGFMTGDSGSVYVCSRDPNSIHVISAVGEKFAVISKDQSTVHFHITAATAEHYTCPMPVQLQAKETSSEHSLNTLCSYSHIDK